MKSCRGCEQMEHGISMTKEIKLPKHVRIGCFNFEIEQWTAQDASSSARYGECSIMVQRIRVDTQYGPVRAANTLLHEILHACSRLGGYDDIENPNEEQTVSQFTDTLLQVWQDNPDVMEWIGRHGGSK